MRKINILYISLISLAFGKCNYPEENCAPKKFNFGNEEYQAQGCFINKLETGEWYFHNAANQIIENGKYEKGIRIGTWHYPENKSDSLIIWKLHEKRNLKLLFNIPLQLEIVEDSLEYIKFSNKDTSKLFNVVVSVHDSQESIEDYFKQGEDEIKAKGWDFTCKKTRITTDLRTIYFNDYTVTVSSVENFRILNMYGLMKDKKLFEISCRYSETTEASARIIFFSLATNSFYNQERFINPFDKIKNITSD